MLPGMNSGTSRTLAAISLVSLIAVSGLDSSSHAQAPARADVSVNFQALTRDGAPIPDLKAEELTLRVAGRQRPIKSLTLVRAGASGGGGGETAKPSSGPSPYSTNTGGGGASSGRGFLILVDTESLRPSVERVLRDSIGKLTDTLSPGDRIGLVTVPRPTLNIPPTTNHAQFKTSLAQLSAAGSQSADICRTRDVLDQLRNQLAALNPSAPTTVVLMSARLSASGNSSGCEVTTSEFQRIQNVMDAARARLYVVMAQETVAERNEGLETLAGVTLAGGVIRLAAGSDDPLARIARETSSYYTLTFEADASAKPGQLGRMELRTTREGATISANNEVPLAGTANAAPAGAVAPRQMLTTTGQFTAFPLRAHGFASRGAEGRINILALLEPIEPGTKFTAVAAGLVDSNGKLVSSAIADEKTIGGQTVAIALAGAPGTYRMRVAATDAKGRSGAVDVPVDANLVSGGGLSFSGLMLGAMGASGCTPRLQFSSTDEKICAILDLYGQPGQLSAGVEIAASPDGPALASDKFGGSTTKEPDRFQLAVALSIASLAPGDYVVRAIIGVPGQPDTKILRTLRKVQ
jgi:hypothetical protein